MSTVAGLRRRNLASLGRYIDELAAGETPPRELEPLDTDTLERERLLLGLRLDEPVELDQVNGALDRDAAERLAAHGLVEIRADGVGKGTLTLTRRGRFLGGGVTAELLA